MSEAMLERPMGGEAALGADALGVTDTARVLPGPVPAHLDEPITDGTDAHSHRRPHTDRAEAERRLPGGDLSPLSRSFRHWFARTISKAFIRTWFHVTVVNRERFQREPALYVFNHLSWMDTVLVIASFPTRPRLFMYGPKEENIHTGGRNRFMWWTGVPIPFSPNKDDILTSVKRAQAVFDTDGVLAIAAEGAIHVHEGDLLPFQEGAAYLALRAGVPIVPVAITGTSWAHFRGRVRVRLGEPIHTGERPTREAVARYTARTWHAVRAMVADDRDGPPPAFVGRWLTDWFNDWGPGGREAASLRRGPDPADVPYGPETSG